MALVSLSSRPIGGGAPPPWRLFFPGPKISLNVNYIHIERDDGGAEGPERAPECRGGGAP